MRPPRQWGPRLMVAVLLGATSAWAAVEGPGTTQFLRAVRTGAPITVDGRLDEPRWAHALPFSDFVQRFPRSGMAPSEPTEVRVLYDDDTLYVGVIARDSAPALIDRRLARRDSTLSSDSVLLVIDPTHGHHTAFAFSLTAGGVQGDGLYYDDARFTRDWDGVWAAAAGEREDGWVAEFAIPLSQLRFHEDRVLQWGFGVHRTLARNSEEVSSVENPRTSEALVSRLGHLTGLEGLRSRAMLEVVPYVATRGLLRPQLSAGSGPTPRLLDPLLDLGVDAKLALSTDLAFNLTVNPDFGQVEADRLLLNLSTFETRFPEKRPFFTQGMELFQPPALPGGGAGPQSLFYSRRIGLTTPVLTAAKVTGSVGSGVDVGVLNALVTGPWRARDDENPDRRLGLHLSRPLHLAPNDTLPDRPLAPVDFFIATARGTVLGSSRVGGTLA
ncbi:DUF5916 domain-containing protein, partial [Pyxidicoccus sp. 3LFB2]